MTASDPNLYGMNLDELTAAVEQAGGEPYRARQLFTELYRHDKLEPGSWQTLPASLREELMDGHVAERPQIAHTSRGADGTVKYLLDLPAGGQVEAVAIPGGARLTLCISSQVGCAFGCSFCMTAKLGFIRHLTAGEIVGQVAAILADTGTERGTFNIVFMGMGEPLHNVDNVLRAVDLLTHEHGFALGPRRITVSTVGLPKGIDRLAEAPIVPRLAVSLVAADQSVRAQLMPVARAVSLDELAEAVRRFGEGKRDRPTFEVVLLRGQNDQEEHAHALAELAQRARAKVNLIEFNPTPELDYEPASEESMQTFLRVLRQAGVVGTVRRSRGPDVDAACGQLAFSDPARR